MVIPMLEIAKGIPLCRIKGRCALGSEQAILLRKMLWCSGCLHLGYIGEQQALLATNPPKETIGFTSGQERS